jgi:septum formation protein
MPRIILASKSPRRKELISQMGIKCETYPSQYNEKLDNSRSPQEVAIELGLGKARNVAAKFPNAIVIGSDTIVSIGGVQLEKPKNIDEAFETLKHLSGKVNEVTTSIAVVCINQSIEICRTDTTRVFFKPFDELKVREYVETGDPMDKAASYGIQSGAEVLIDHIEGSYDTVIGLPTELLSSILAEIGVESTPVKLKAPVAQVK